MRYLLPSVPLLLLLLTIPSVAQNELKFFDGTTEWTSRGGNATQGKEILVRIPADQLWGATAITKVYCVIQDQDYTTAEPIGVVVRKNDSVNGGPLGAPDPTPAGLIGSITPVALPFPNPGSGVISAMVWNFTFPTPLALPAPTGVMPNDDVYVGLWFPNPVATWPNDGVSCHMSGTQTSPTAAAYTLGEQNSATTVGYGGLIGQAGLSWEIVLTGPQPGFASICTMNRAWNIGISFVDDVLQPFAENALVFNSSPPSSTSCPTCNGTGANPNFGYAGIFPDEFRTTGPDNFGYRVRATAPIGSTSFLFVSFATLNPTIPVLPVGWLSLDPNLMFPGMFLPFTQAPTVASTGGMPATTSEATFGPYPGIPNLAGVAIYAQCLTATATGGLRLSTTGTIHF